MACRKERYGKINIKNFYIRRTLRIWPLYFLIIALAPLLVYITNAPQPDYIPNLFFYNNFSTIHTMRWDYPFAHLWSICIEEHFYIVWPLLILFTPKKYLTALFSIVILGCCAFRFYTFQSNPEPWYTLYLHTFSRIDVLVIGALIAYLHFAKAISFSLNATIRSVLFIILFGTLIFDIVGNCFDWFLVVFKKYFYIGLFAILIFDYNLNRAIKPFRFGHKIWSYLGKVSFGIYMYGNLFFLVILGVWMPNMHTKNLYIYIILLIATSILIPIISYELYEKYFLTLKKRFTTVPTGNS
ncbi:MAG: acyltransferase [Bacteroidota bacterium]|nr:acyltransferase [Bacteroidota bacterium]